MEKIVSLCKRRGFIFQSSGIYGGLASTWDYGSLGAELKRNLKDAWWCSNVYERDDVEGLDASILMRPETWMASGHVTSFEDTLVDCKSCKKRFKIEHVTGKKCPECGGELTEARQFNLMLKTHLGPIEDEGATGTLRVVAAHHDLARSVRTPVCLLQVLGVEDVFGLRVERQLGIRVGVNEEMRVNFMKRHAIVLQEAPMIAWDGVGDRLPGFGGAVGRKRLRAAALNPLG